MNTTVIISTYNGERFIYEQLKSIAEQSLKVDNVFIIDDASTDGTVEIVRNFIKKEQLLGWHLEINKNNIGWKKNFYILLSKIRTDLVFYCDQDDIWDRERVKITVGVFEKNKDIKCLSCDYASIDSTGEEIIGDSKLTYIQDGSVSEIDYKDDRFHIRGLGCLLVCTNEIVTLIEQGFSKDELFRIPPDFMISRVSMMLKGFYTIDLKLVRHRFHDDNASNSSEIVNRLQGSNTLMNRMEMLDNELLITKVMLKKTEMRNIKEYFNYLKYRRDFLCKGDFLSLVKALWIERHKYAMILILADIAYYYNVQGIAGFVYRKIFIK